MILIKNGKIYASPNKIIDHGFVLVQGDKILQVGPMADLQDSNPTRVIDAKGGLVMPGLIDAHCHIGMWEDGLGFEGDDGNEDTDPCTPHLRAMDAINPLDKAFAQALGAGITTVVTGPGSSNPIAGQICAMKTYGNCVDTMVIKPYMAMKMALGENPKTTFHAKAQAPVTRMAVAAIIREQLQKAKRYQADIDAAAQSDELDPPEFDAKCQALLPLLQGQVKAHIHAHRADDIFTAIRIAKEFNIGYVLVHCTEGYLIAEHLAAEKSPVIFGPMLGARTKPELANYLEAAPGILESKGVHLAIATDHPELPIHYLALSAAIAQVEGLSEAGALAAITWNAAQICGIDHRVGSLEVGKDADIAVFSAGPLGLGAKPTMVIAGGTPTPCQ